MAVPGCPISLTATDLVFGAREVMGALTGKVFDNGQTLAFANLQNIRSRIETFPLERVQAACDRTMRADVGFGAVLVLPARDGPASA